MGGVIGWFPVKNYRRATTVRGDRDGEPVVEGDGEFGETAIIFERNRLDGTTLLTYQKCFPRSSSSRKS
jgi:hypothetical protein